MVRILHFADLHIGVENYSRPATDKDVDDLPDTFAPDVADRRQTYVGLPTRLLDSLRAFDELVEGAIVDRVDLVLFCGDAYRTRDPSQTHQREFARRVARLTSHDIPVFLLTGNHDLPNAFGRATSLEIFDTLRIPNVTVASRIATHRLETRNGPIQILAVPWLRKSFVAAQENVKALSFEEQNEWIQGFLTSAIAGMIEETDTNVPTVIAAHGTVARATVGSERSMLLGTDYVLLPSAFQDRRVDYVALGHIHRNQQLGESPPVFYSGSVHRVDFSEESEEKGFMVVDIEPGPASGRLVRHEFKKLWSRSFVTVEVTINDDDVDPTETVIAAVTRKSVDDAVVRVNVELPDGVVSALDLRQVRQALETAHAVTGINLTVRRLERTRLGTGLSVETLRPLDALELYLGVRNTPQERRQKLMQHAARLVSGGPGDEKPPFLFRDQREESETPAPWLTRIAGPGDVESAFEVRRRVFIDEQGVDPDVEWDGRDDIAVHAVALIGWNAIGTGRLVPTDDPRVMRIGRVAVVSEHRREGVGASILGALEDRAHADGADRAVLHAQTYVKSFYSAHGYVEEGEPFVEAGIEHIAMSKSLGEPALDGDEISRGNQP